MRAKSKVLLLLALPVLFASTLAESATHRVHFAGIITYAFAPDGVANPFVAGQPIFGCYDVDFKASTLLDRTIFQSLLTYSLSLGPIKFRKVRPSAVDVWVHNAPPGLADVMVF